MKWMIGIVPALLLAAWGRSESSGSRHQVTEPEEWTLPREGASGLDLRLQRIHRAQENLRPAPPPARHKRQVAAVR